MASNAADFFDDDFGKIGHRPVLTRHPEFLLPIDLIYDLRLKFVKHKHTLKVIPKNIIVIVVEVPGREKAAARVLKSLESSIHRVTTKLIQMENRGKLQNTNVGLRGIDLADFDYVIMADDDIILPACSCDLLVAAMQRHGLSIAQPAHRLSSHATYIITRRQWGRSARVTRFVEVGPLVIFDKSTFGRVFPLPELKWGWGLDIYWSSLSVQLGWRIGVIDEVPMRHYRPIGGSYNTSEAKIEAIKFLEQNTFLSRNETFVTTEDFF